MRKTLSYRLKLGVAPLALGVAAISQPAFAQDAAAQAEEAEAPGEAIIVTGSRIASPTITSVSPVLVTTSDDIQKSGVSNIQDVLLENPAFGTPGLSRTNSAFLTSGAGVATVDLRDLGSDRTLVLINSRRVVAGLPGTATVDLNVIPTQFIERVDILTGGASSLYGSDAVAGVVNFIYKDNMEGVEANAQYNITERGDGREYQANLTFGSNFAEDRGNMMMHVGYARQGYVRSRNRSNTFTDDIDTFQFTGDPADYGVPTQPFYSSFPSQGRFIVGGRTFTYSPTGQLQPCFTSNGATCSSPLGTGVGPNGFNRQYYRTIAVPVERYLFAARGRYDITDNIRLFAEGTYANTSSQREIEPFPLESGGANGIFPKDGAAPLETLVNGVLVRNPFVPDAIFNAATDTNGDGLKDMAFARRLTEFGTRNGSVNRNFYRFVTGLEGTFADSRFNWDLSYNYGRTSESQQSNGQVNVLNFRNALSAITDANGNPICADENARRQGCVPINLFGAGAISPEAVKYIAADQTLETRVTQQVVQGNISGSLFDLPAGPLGVAVGAEYRKESSYENNDALTNAGLNAGNALPDTSGSFDVKEVYGEVNIPVLADTSFFNSLNLRAAGRISDYSTVGTVYSYSGGVEWSPVEDIRFSGTYARSVRAPNIGELYTGPSQTFPSVTDPCVGIGATGGGTTGDMCRADAGVAANIAANGVFTLSQADRQGVSGFNSGNPNLNEEKSDSYTASVTFTPRSVDFLRNTVLRVDYYNIKVTNSVVSPGRAFILDQCYNQGNTDYCDFVVRRQAATAINSAGSLDLVNTAAINGGALKAEGVDVSLRSHWPVDSLDGRIKASLVYTHLIKGEVITLPGEDPDRFDGEIGSAKDRFTASLGYEGDAFDLTFTGKYIGNSCEDDQWLAAFDLEKCAVKIPSEFYLDTQAGFRAGDNYEFYIGVDNLLDNKAPNILSGSTFNVTGTDTAADVYDVFGRRYYAGVRLKF